MISDIYGYFNTWFNNKKIVAAICIITDPATKSDHSYQ